MVAQIFGKDLAEVQFLLGAPFKEYLMIGSIANLVAVVRLDDGDWKITYKQNGELQVVTGYLEDDIGTEHEGGQLSSLSLHFIPNED